MHGSQYSGLRARRFERGKLARLLAFVLAAPFLPGCSGGGAMGEPSTGGSPGQGGGATVGAGGASSGSGGTTTATGSGGATGTGGAGPATGTGGSGTGGTAAGGGGTAGAPGGGSSGNGSGGTTVENNACGVSISIDENPFGCEFAWGANGNFQNRASYLDFITTWVGEEWTQGRENDCDDCGMVSDLASTNATAVYYAYFIGFALPDCNNNPGGGDDLCTAGAAFIRDNYQRILDLYSNYAQRTYQASPDKGVVWLLEGDFMQYTESTQSRPLSIAELGQLATDITCAIKSNAPNAIVAINHTTWNGDDETDDFWAVMPLDLIDLVWTTGAGDTDGFFAADTADNPSAYNRRTATYRYVHELTGKPVWVDTSFGRSQQADSWSVLSAEEINARISEGVIAANVTEPDGSYQSRIQSLAASLDSVCE